MVFTNSEIVSPDRKNNDDDALNQKQESTEGQDKSSEVFWDIGFMVEHENEVDNDEDKGQRNKTDVSSHIGKGHSGAIAWLNGYIFPYHSNCFDESVPVR